MSSALRGPSIRPFSVWSHRSQPAVLCRTIVLTAFDNSAARALAERPDLLAESPAEQMRRLLKAFATG